MNRRRQSGLLTAIACHPLSDVTQAIFVGLIHARVLLDGIRCLQFAMGSLCWNDCWLRVEYAHARQVCLPQMLTSLLKQYNRAMLSLGCVCRCDWAPSISDCRAIPFFDQLVSLIGALLGTIFTIQFEAAIWLQDTWNPRNRTTRHRQLVAFNVFLLLAGTFDMITGTWGAAVAINDQLNGGDTTSPFSCKDDTGS